MPTYRPSGKFPLTANQRTLGRLSFPILAASLLQKHGQQAEAAVGVPILNRMLDAGRPDSVRLQTSLSKSAAKWESPTFARNNAIGGGVAQLRRDQSSSKIPTGILS